MTGRIVVTDADGEEVYRGTAEAFLEHNDDEDSREAVMLAQGGETGLIGGGAAPAVYVTLEPAGGAVRFPCSVCELTYDEMEQAEVCERDHEKPLPPATEAQRSLAKRVVVVHKAGGWYRAMDNGERPLLVSLVKRLILKRRAYSGNDGEAGASYEYRCSDRLVAKARARSEAKKAAKAGKGG